MYAGIVSALWRREATGQGALVEVAMFDAALPTLLSSLAMALGTDDETPVRTGNRHSGLAEAPYNVFPARDGYVAIICVTDRQWRALAEVIGGAPLADDERFTTRGLRVENLDALDATVAPWTSARMRSEVVDALTAIGVPAAPVRDLREVVRDEDLRARQVLMDLEHPTHGPVRVFSSPIRYDGQAPLTPAPPPGIGEHTDEVTREWLAAPAVLKQ
jgi:crotonobetainyl-CoA:carnitine CoA-transferase CaiB-like acyl-CoA transferase